MSGLFCRLYSIFLWKIMLANNVGPDQTPHYVASDRGLQVFAHDPYTSFQVRKSIKEQFTLRGANSFC